MLFLPVKADISFKAKIAQQGHNGDPWQNRADQVGGHLICGGEAGAFSPWRRIKLTDWPLTAASINSA